LYAIYKKHTKLNKLPGIEEYIENLYINIMCHIFINIVTINIYYIYIYIIVHVLINYLRVWIIILYSDHVFNDLYQHIRANTDNTILYHMLRNVLFTNTIDYDNQSTIINNKIFIILMLGVLNKMISNKYKFFYVVTALKKMATVVNNLPFVISLIIS